MPDETGDCLDDFSRVREVIGVDLRRCIDSPGLTGSDTSVEYPLQSFPGKRPETAASESLAEVAELADAHGSGPCARKGVGVRVPSSAPFLICQRISDLQRVVSC